VLRETGPTLTRRISLDTVRDAAETVYRAAIRTPLVRLDLPGQHFFANLLVQNSLVQGMLIDDHHPFVGLGDDIAALDL